MVARYLASPRYGERWGKHWLDAAGYADSNGYFNADSDRPSPTATATTSFALEREQTVRSIRSRAARR